jgi:hypothetical protein
MILTSLKSKMACEEALWPRFVLETTVAISETLGHFTGQFQVGLSKIFMKLY